MQENEEKETSTDEVQVQENTKQISASVEMGPETHISFYKISTRSLSRG